MTRDEAVKKLWVPSPPQEWALGAYDAGQFVDRLVALGMLKIDDPPSIESRFRKAVSPIGEGVVGPWAGNIWECIHSSGLKIVEK